MADIDPPALSKSKGSGSEPAAKPSQAEGERDIGTPANASTQGQTPAAPTPGQAEGDRETVDAGIREKESKGEL